MKIETNTRPVDLLEVLGDQASMLDAAFFLEVLRNEGVQNTEDVSAHQWERMVAKIGDLDLVSRHQALFLGLEE